ncbi:MAG: two-component regulator propeller domain-containing protein, partial [Bacteroidota bacterium]
MQKKLKYIFKRNWGKVRFQALLLLLLLSCSAHLIGQSPYFTKSAANDFLGGATIQSIYESELGFLWLGTNQGVYRYDGLEFKAYELPSDSTVSSSIVSTIYQTSNKQMLIAFEDGNLYEPSYDGQLILWEDTKLFDLSTPITGLWETQDQLWIATYGEGLLISTPDSIYRYDQDNGLLGNDIYEIIVDEASQKVYLATDLGINTCSMVGNEVQIENQTTESGLSGYVIQSLKRDPEGVYVGTFENGVFFWNPAKQSVLKLFEEWDFGSVTSIELFEDRELWIGTERRGLIQYQLNDQTFRLINEVDGLGLGRIEDLHKDAEGNLWVVSSTLGLIKANRHFDFLGKSVEQIQNIQALATDQNNQLWIGTQDGVFIMETQEGERTYTQPLGELQVNVLSLFQDINGCMWIGTFGDGIYIYDPDTEQIRHLTQEDGLVDGSVLSIDGVDNKIWVGTFAGVTQFIAPEDIFFEADIPYNLYDVEEKLNAVFIYKVFVDSKKRTWLGTDSEGINTIEEEELSYYAGADTIPFKSVYSITEDLQGDIWFTTTTEGLFRFDGETFLRFGLEDGLRNLNITSLITDVKGNILILHPNGIDILDP